MANLITNSSFETNTSGWYLEGAFTRSSTYAYDGSYSIKLLAASGYGNFVSDAIAVSASTQYVLTLYRKVTVNSGDSPKLQLNKTDAYTGQLSVGGWTDLPAAANFTKTTVNLTTESGQTNLWVRILNYNGNVVCYFDLFVLDLPTAIKTINGQAKASVKTKDNLAIALVKSINGLA